MSTLAIADNSALFSDIQDLDAQQLDGGYLKIEVGGQCYLLKICYDFGPVSGSFKIAYPAPA
jgi:hypothetical protein